MSATEAPAASAGGTRIEAPVEVVGVAVATTLVALAFDDSAGVMTLETSTGAAGEMAGPLASTAGSIEDSAVMGASFEALAGAMAASLASTAGSVEALAGAMAASLASTADALSTADTFEDSAGGAGVGRLLALSPLAGALGPLLAGLDFACTGGDDFVAALGASAVVAFDVTAAFNDPATSICIPTSSFDDFEAL